LALDTLPISSALARQTNKPASKNLLLKAYTSLLQTSAFSLHDASLTDEEAKVLASQATVGWHHLLVGRLSTDWARIQLTHATMEKLDKDKFSGPSWTSKLIKHIWKALMAHWQVRNEALGDTPEENEAAQRSRLHPLVARLYARQAELHPHDL
jgi:hypothetical protein